MRNEFSTLDIEKALDITRERLRDWVIRGYVAPTVPAAGQGTKATFTRFDIYGIELFRQLIEDGCNRDAAGGFVRQFIEREKKEPERQRTAYIKFMKNTDGKVWRIETLADGIGKTIKMDYETGETEASGIKLSQVMKTKRSEWQTIVIKNFKQIRSKVDAALDRL